MPLARILHLSDPQSLGAELERIGSSAIVARDGLFRLVEVKGLSPGIARSLWEEIWAVGGVGALGTPGQATSILLMATLAQYDRLMERLEREGPQLQEVAHLIARTLAAYDSYPEKPIFPEWFPHSIFPKGVQRTLIMGILNVTPDSFSDGGAYFSPESALSRAEEMIQEGADLIDVGGESTRPGAEPVSPEEEIRRVLPVVQGLVQRGYIVSVDTTKVEVAELVLKAGAHIINDISGLRFNPDLAKIVAKYRAGLVIMHSRGTPQNMQTLTDYENLIEEIYEFLAGQVDFALSQGVSPEKIILDPGIGFAKTVEQNLEILRRLPEFKSLGYPILVGPSRKSFIGAVLGGLPPSERVEGTSASVALAIAGGARILRVHDVKAMVRVCRVTEAILWGTL